ncbi:hypothetical protein AAC387_Pa09g1371 [Persea americana]
MKYWSERNLFQSLQTDLNLTRDLTGNLRRILKITSSGRNSSSDPDEFCNCYRGWKEIDFIALTKRAVIFLVNRGTAAQPEAKANEAANKDKNNQHRNHKNA